MNRANGSCLALTLCLVIALTACAAGISSEARSQVTYSGPFDALVQQPDKFVGETVLWGGKVITTDAQDKATEIVVLQLALDSQDRPRDDDQSQGRFIVRTDRFLDPAIFSPGTLITVVGAITGTQVRPIGQMAYRYPVVKVTEIKKWPVGTADPSPRFHFGFGIGTHF